MDEHGLSELIDRIVRDARIPSARERVELRRELESHFADAGTSPDGLRAAVERFGNPQLVSGALARAHRHNRILLHAARLLVASMSAVLVAVAIQLIMNLRLDAQSNVGLAPTFVTSAVFSTMLVGALVAAWELDIEAFCARLERRPLRLVATVAGLSTVMLLFHSAHNSWLHPGKAFFESSIDVVIWTCTIAILALADRVFARVFTRIERT